MRPPGGAGTDRHVVPGPTAVAPCLRQTESLPPALGAARSRFSIRHLPYATLSCAVAQVVPAIPSIFATLLRPVCVARTVLSDCQCYRTFSERLRPARGFPR